MKFERNPSKAFSLLELLTVTAVVSVLATISLPALGHLAGGNMRGVETGVRGLLENARQFSMAHRTYVRVGFAEFEPAVGERLVMIQCVHSTTGDLDHDTSAEINDETLWRSSDRPMVLRNVSFDTSFVSAAVASGFSEIFPSFTRKSGGKAVEYRKVVQFDPHGQISIDYDGPVRFAALGFSNPRKPENAVGFVLSGLSGGVQTQRRDNP